MKSDENLIEHVPREPSLPEADRTLRLYREFREAGEALADDLARAGLPVKAAVLRGSLVILANATIDEGRLAEPGYTEALVALHEVES
jgi:hypothetical protein